MTKNLRPTIKCVPGANDSDLVLVTATCGGEDWISPGTARELARLLMREADRAEALASRGLPEEDGETRFAWTVEIEADEELVADGFELTPARTKRMVESALPYSLGRQTRVRVLAAPDQREIRRVQGFPLSELPPHVATETSIKCERPDCPNAIAYPSARYCGGACAQLAEIYDQCEHPTSMHAPSGLPNGIWKCTVPGCRCPGLAPFPKVTP